MHEQGSHPKDGHPSDANHGRAAHWRSVGSLLAATIRTSLAAAEASLESLGTAAARREAVRTARRELKAVRALAPLCRGGTNDGPIDGLAEFGAKANQLLGPLRDRDALTRSIHRIADRFADGATRRIVRTVLLATLVLGESDRRDDSAFADATIGRARRALRAARACALRLDGDRFDPAHATALLSRTHRECARELDAALRHGDLARLHECRKKASFLALALRPFEDDVPSALRRLRGRAKRLASALGEDRDLALLDVEMAAAREQLDGSPLAAAIDDALRLARLESGARVEDAAASFLRVRRGRARRALATVLSGDADPDTDGD